MKCHAPKKTRTPKTRMTVLTIGHSTRKLETFLHLLQAHEVSCIVDIRTIPRSRHNPQFNRETLPKALREAGIAYEHMAGLGGLRHAHADSANTAWHNASFRGFADYMQTEEFHNALQALLEVASQERIVLMCAEAVPWRCHRWLIADALVARKVRVEHIISGIRTQPHSVTPWARVKDRRVTYPSPKEILPTRPTSVRRTVARRQPPRIVATTRRSGK
jgi:uncharacterized protein (DUF488 family)